MIKLQRLGLEVVVHCFFCRTTTSNLELLGDLPSVEPAFEKVGTRKAQAGFQAALHQLTVKAYLPFLLNEINLDIFIGKHE